ncbi:phosphopyruvate hydratase [bacterium]|nr:phosphopyruvate hydratase [bacterium]
MKVTQIIGREIFDSRGFPTVECEIVLDGTHGVIASVPSGASKGKHEAVELRDGQKRLDGKGVTKAITNIEEIIAPALIGQEPNVVEADLKMIALDGTENKSKLGANAILPVSIAMLRAQAAIENLETYELIAGLCELETIALPIPLINIINGGMHADNNLAIQEFMVVARGQQSVRGSIEATSLLFYELKNLLKKKNLSTLVGDEGGFAPNFRNEYEALDTLMEAINSVEKKHNQGFVIAIDAAANSFYNEKTKLYELNNKKYSSDEMIAWYEKLAKDYPLFSIEDGLYEEDWDGWAKLTQKLGADVQIIGDDLFTTNQNRIVTGLEKGASNAVLIKPNQIGTITETLQAISLCKEHELNTVVSHRSGETEDTFIVDLAVGTNSGQIKIGGLTRGERTAKYNQLLRIEDRLTRSAMEDSSL